MHQVSHRVVNERSDFAQGSPFRAGNWQNPWRSRLDARWGRRRGDRGDDHDLDFRLLGPLEVARAGRVIDLGKGRERSVLGLLLLHANQVVPVDRFLDDLWGEQPPASAGHALQVHISNLRKRLGSRRGRVAGGSGHEVIQTRKPGLPVVRRGRPDRRHPLRTRRRGRPGRAGRRSVRRGRAAPAGGAWPCGAGPRSPTWPTRRGPGPRPARLEERRLAVLEDRFDADLAGGRHADVVGEIEAVARQHPMRERVWGAAHARPLSQRSAGRGAAGRRPRCATPCATSSASIPAPRSAPSRPPSSTRSERARAETC